MGNLLKGPKMSLLGVGAGAGILPHTFDPNNWVDWARVIGGILIMIAGAVAPDPQ